MYQARAVTVGELLSNGSFRMPDFQRPYSWEEETALQLYDDIHSAMQFNEVHFANFDDYEPYFLGPIIVIPNGPAAPADLVDGQQRLVTLTSMLAVVRDKIRDPAYRSFIDGHIWRSPNPHYENEPQPRLRVRELDQDRFNKLVQKDGATDDLPAMGETPAEERILTVLMRLKAEIGSVAQNYLRALTRFVLEKCVVLQISAQSLSTGYRVFRGINSRGQPLHPLDIVRAELLGAPTHDASLITDAWSEAEDVLGPEQLQSYVEAVLHSVAPQQWDGDLARGFRRVMSDPQKSVLLRTRIKDFLQAHSAIEGGGLDFGRDSDLVSRRLECIRNLPFDDWRPCVLLFLTQGPSGRDFYRLLQRIDALGLVSLLNGATKTVTRRRFADISRTISHGHDVFAATSPLTIGAAELNQAKRKLDSPFRPMPKFARHLLLRLNEAMCTPEIPAHFPKELTIEHILPQTPQGEWLNAFPVTVERTVLTHKLGNLAILTRPINAAAKNRAFSQKKEAVFGSANGNVFALTANLASYQTWTPTHLRRRHDDLLTIANDLLSPP